MDENKLFLSISDFLNDDFFIAWRLFKTEELDMYWEEFLKKNPQSETLLHEACKRFDTAKLKDTSFSSEAEEALYEKIRNNIYARKRNKRQLITYWVSVASFLLLIVGSIVFFTLREKSPSFVAQGEIIEETFPGENVQLISGNNVINLESNSTITLSDKGQASVTDSARNTKALQLAENKTNKLIVPYGKRSFITLADGTNVWLNSGTEMDFPSSFEGDLRDIRVKGEIYIEVAKSSRPFLVHTERADIRVLGTKFNVSAYQDDVTESIVLVEGSVQVNTSYHPAVVLKPSEMATVSTENITTETVDVLEYISWRNGVLEFEGMPMAEVLKKIGRYYNVSFESADMLLNEKTVSGKFILSNNLDSVMKSVSLLSSINYTRENNRIFIEKK